MGTVERPDQTSSKPCINIWLSATALIRMSNAREINRGWSYLTYLYKLKWIKICFGSLTLFQNKYITLFFLWWRVWMRLMTDMILLTCTWKEKSMHVSFAFFTSQCTHPLGSCIVLMKKNRRIGRVYWFVVICTTAKSYSVIITSNQQSQWVVSILNRIPFC